MKYFTKDLWRGAQSVGPEFEENRAQWQRAYDAYRANLEELRGRLDDDAYPFFAEADVHDAKLLDLRITDGIRPASLGETTRPSQNLILYPVRVELTVLDAWEQYIWRLTYSSTRSILVDFPSDDPLFQTGGFDDLGYHELADAGNGFLRHEILFSSGAVLAFEFSDVAISSTPARPSSSQTP